jgi:CpeT protein
LPGCEVVLNRTDDGYFEGGTNGKNCSNNFRDSSYVTSEVIIDKDRMISWDREFDENGKQVLGPNKGGYIFKKKLNRLQKRY